MHSFIDPGGWKAELALQQIVYTQRGHLSTIDQVHGRKVRRQHTDVLTTEPCHHIVYSVGNGDSYGDLCANIAGTWFQRFFQFAVAVTASENITKNTHNLVNIMTKI